MEEHPTSENLENPDTDSGIVNIDFPDYPEFELKELNYEGGKPFSKDEAAAGIANKIVYAFVGALSLSFLLIITVIILALYYPNEVNTIMVPALGGNLFEAIKITGTIFSPLLAFILGYYFNKDSKS